MNPATPSNATAEGTHIRCFEKAALCALPYGHFPSTYDAAQQILNYYKQQRLLPQPTTSVRACLCVHVHVSVSVCLSVSACVCVCRVPTCLPVL